MGQKIIIEEGVLDITFVHEKTHVQIPTHVLHGILKDYLTSIPDSLTFNWKEHFNDVANGRD